MQLSQVNFSNVALTPFASAKGVKTSSATIGNAPIECPFGISAFNDPQQLATRLNCELDVTGSSVLPALQAMEQEVLRQANAAKIFEEKPEDVARMFHSNLTYSEKYQSTRLKCKLNKAGYKPCRFFDHPSKDQKPFESFEFRTCTVKPYLHFKGLWKQGNSFGMQLEVKDMLVSPTAEAPHPF